MSKFRLIALMTLGLCCCGVRVPANEELPGGGQATPVASITLPDGFRAPLLRSAQKGEGSWVSMTCEIEKRPGETFVRMKVCVRQTARGQPTHMPRRFH